MNCNKAQEMISLYIDNKLSSQSVNELKKHFTECSKCQQDYLTLKKIKTILSNTPKQEVSSDFTASVMKRIKSKETEKQDNVVMFGSFFNSMKKKLIMAAGFLFVAASSYFFFMPNNINKYDAENYASIAMEYYLDSDNYEQSDIDNDDYEEYILSVFC